MGNVVDVERIIEAGVYRHKKDLEGQILAEPIINANIHITFALPAAAGLLQCLAVSRRKICEFAPLAKIDSYLTPRILALESVKELSRVENGLDQSIKSSYDVVHSGVKQKRFLWQKTQALVYEQKKFYFLMEKEGLANVSELTLSLQARYDNNEFNRIYVKARLRGIMAGENNPLAGRIVDYWHKNNLIILNNAIIEDDEKTTYVDGSIKASAFKAFFDEYQIMSGMMFDREYSRLNGEAKKMISSSVELNKLRELFLEAGKAQFPVRLIKE